MSQQTGREIDSHLREYQRCREKAAAFAAEAAWALWMARGCPADRTYMMGWSLLDGPKAWGPLAPPPR